MRFLVSIKEFYPFSIGGAEISLFTLLKELAKKHYVVVVCAGKVNKETRINNITIYTRKILPNTIGFYCVTYFLNLFAWKKVVIKYIKRIQPDLILTQLGFAPAVVFAGKENNISTVTFLRDFTPFCPLSFNKKTVDMCNKICKDCHASIHHKLLAFFIKKIMVQHRLSLEQSSMVIANSNYLAKISKSVYGIEADVIRPFIQLNNYIAKKSGLEKNKITFINPQVNKGVEIFFKIATALPMYQFQVVGEFRKPFLKHKFFNRKSLYKNITFMKIRKEMKYIYETTKILLVPSLWQEPFGRVCIEAMANGIPCIVSNRGGLSEAVGDCGVIIDNPFKIEVWVNSIRKLMEDENLYNELSRNCIERAKGYNFDITYENFLRIIKNKLNFLEL
ncbi:MAG: glycosyltransferase [Atribacterota bacterium]|nr:glycosyltransferase [Atribacterota bacterium]